MNFAALLVLVFGSGLYAFGSWQIVEQKPRHTARVQDGVLRLAVDDVRPLAATVTALEDACQCPINYEDAPLRYAADLVDQSAPSLEGRAMAPRGGLLELSVGLSDEPLRASLEDVLVRAIREYEAQGFPAQYVVRIYGGQPSLVPSAYRTRDGSTSHSVQLDTRVSFPKRERTLLETLDLINLEQGRFSGSKVITGMVPVNALLAKTIELGARDEPARDLLAKVLAKLGRPSSWQLLYSYSQRMFALNVRVF